MTRGVVQDIGELKKAEQEIRKLNEEQERRRHVHFHAAEKGGMSAPGRLRRFKRHSGQ